jgi:hypothetical protein
MSEYQQVFGPVVIEFHDAPGKLVAKCQSGRFDCRGRVGNACTWNKDEGKARPLPSDMVTPDWCQYKASAIRDAEGMQDDA